MTETVCAVVVTYNRKNLLIECLEALRKQTRPLEGIYIIDNASTDGTPELLKEKGYIKELPPNNLTEPWEKEFEVKNLVDGNSIKIHYVRMHKNTGGAGGFYEGVKRAYEKGYDWLWLMDDDVEAVEEGLNSLLKYKSISSCIHPSKIYKDGSIFKWNGYLCEFCGTSVNKADNFKDKGFTVVNYGCFEGMLISREIIKKIGFPEKKLFMIGDDTLYGYLASNHTNVLYVKDIVLIKKIKPSFSKLHLYLKYRNRTYIFFHIIAKNKYFFVCVQLLKAFRDILRYKSIIPLIGLLHGIFQIWGKEKKYMT